jgi:hypothetical protein
MTINPETIIIIALVAFILGLLCGAMLLRPPRYHSPYHPPTQRHDY